MLAMNTYNEEHDDKNILVVDSESASCGESQLALKAMEYEEEGLSFEEISSKLLNFRDTMSTYCVIDNLETLRKNGRLSKVSALAASTLNIKPLLMGVKGELEAAGKHEEALKANEALLPLMDELFITSNPIMVKEALKLVGFPVGGLRLPLIPATPEQSAELAEVMRQCAPIH